MPLRIGNRECTAGTVDSFEEIVVLHPGEEAERENPLTTYLRSLDMSAEEMFLGNFLVGVTGALGEA